MSHAYKFCISMALYVTCYKKISRNRTEYLYRLQLDIESAAYSYSNSISMAYVKESKTMYMTQFSIIFIALL